MCACVFFSRYSYFIIRAITVCSIWIFSITDASVKDCGKFIRAVACSDKLTSERCLTFLKGKISSARDLFFLNIEDCSDAMQNMEIEKQENNKNLNKFFMIISLVD